MNKMTALSASNVHMSYGSQRVIVALNIEAQPGQMLGLVGPNGSGKTTLLKILSGILKPQIGAVFLGGDDIQVLSHRDRAKRIALVPQTPSVPEGITALEAVLMGRNPHLGMLEWEGPADIEACRRVMDGTDTWRFSQRLISSLSGGERQRVFIARALAQEAPILLMDEPTANLDIRHQNQVMDLVVDLSQSGLTVCVAMHDLSLAARFCHSLALLQDGRLLADGEPWKVLTRSNIESTFGVKSAVHRDLLTDVPAVRVWSCKVSPKDTTIRESKVHVIGGGDKGGGVVSALTQAGFSVSAGVLAEGDTDHQTVRALGVSCPTHPSFAHISPELHQQHIGLIKQAHCVGLADICFGDSNLLHLEAAFVAERLIMVEDGPIHLRDYTDGRGTRLYAQLRQRATVTSNAGLVREVKRMLGVSQEAKDSI